MIGRQVYRRDEFRVAFPELEKSPVEFKTFRKYYGNRKNEGSPEFRVSTISAMADAASQPRPSFPGENAPSPAPQASPSDWTQQRRLVEAEEIERLKEELRSKEEEIRRLVEADRSRQQLSPEPRESCSRNLTALELYQLGTQSRAPTQTRPFNQMNQTPFIKPHSQSPFRSPPPHPSIFHSNSSVSSHSPLVHELALHPAFQQPRYTTQHPKVYSSDPITGSSRHKPFADYGNLLLSPVKSSSVYRKQL